MIDRLLAVEAHDVVVEQRSLRLFALARQGRQHVNEHGNHHFRPALPNQGQRAIEIQEHMCDPLAGREGRGKLNQAAVRVLLHQLVTLLNGSVDEARRWVKNRIGKSATGRSRGVGHPPGKW